MEASDRVAGDAMTSVGGVRALPAVRALAKKLGVDLARVAGTGADGVVTMQDVKQAAAAGTAKLPSPSGRGAGGEGAGLALRNAATEPSPTALRAAPSPGGKGEGGGGSARFDADPRSAAGKPMRTVPPTVEAQGQPEPLRGVRRNMARVMAEAHAQVVPATLCDDADLHAWQPGNDITVRLVRAIVAASRAVPALNAWFDAAAGTRTLHRRVDIGIAVDTEDGLFVPALRNADMLDAAGVRAAVDRIRDQVRERTIPAEELKGYTISLSNFGVFAGRYATPVVVPPCVAIVAAGKLRHELVPVMGGVETHRLLPLSLTFDHRAATGGEAARFLRALLDDLARAT
jgi:pyruvate dehydrogenase E2 component (dihydrolipoamide acetyltransferase)